MRSSDILTLDNHDLYDRVRLMLVAKPTISFEWIAQELGVEPMEVVHWFLAYKAPRGTSKPYQSPRLPAIGQPRFANRVVMPESEEDRRRKAIWKRQHEGAKAALSTLITTTHG